MIWVPLPQFPPSRRFLAGAGAQPSDGPCWTSEGNEELARWEEQLCRDKAAEWEMNMLLEKWGFVKEDGVVNWCLESPCPLSSS